MVQLYTPFLTQAGAAIGRGLERRFAREEQGQRNQLIQSAYMQQPGALEQLMSVDPQAAMKVKQQITQEEQQNIQSANKEKEDKLKYQKQLAENIEPVRKQLANFDSYDKAKAYFDQTLSQNKDLIDAAGVDPNKFALTPEGFNQLKTAYAPAEEKPKFNDAASLRKEYTSATKDYAQINDATARILASAKDPSPAGDMALIFNYMKALDPGSTVREGEFATAQNAAGVPGRIQSLYNNIVKGERLNEEQRKDFVKRSIDLFGEAKRIQEGRMNEYSKLAERAKLNPEDVVYNRTFITDDMIKSALGEKKEEGQPGEKMKQPPSIDEKNLTVEYQGKKYKFPDIESLRKYKEASGL